MKMSSNGRTINQLTVEELQEICGMIGNSKALGLKVVDSEE